MSKKLFSTETIKPILVQLKGWILGKTYSRKEGEDLSDLVDTLNEGLGNADNAIKDLHDNQVKVYEIGINGNGITNSQEEIDEIIDGFNNNPNLSVVKLKTFLVKEINAPETNFTEAEWDTYGAVNNTKYWTTGSGYDNSHINVGDVACIRGKVSNGEEVEELVDAVVYGVVTSKDNLGRNISLKSFWLIINGEGIVYSNYKFFVDKILKGNIDTLSFGSFKTTERSVVFNGSDDTMNYSLFLSKDEKSSSFSFEVVNAGNESVSSEPKPNQFIYTTTDNRIIPTKDWGLSGVIIENVSNIYYRDKRFGVITFPKNLTRFPFTVRDLYNLRKVIIGTGQIKTLPGNSGQNSGGLFKNCTNLTEAVLPNDLEILPEGIFWGCSSLVEFEIPSTVKELHREASGYLSMFMYCTSLRRLTFPKNLETFLGHCFAADCISLTEISLPPAYTVSLAAFNNCVNLKSIIVENTGSNCQLGSGISFTNVYIEKLDLYCKSFIGKMPSVAKLKELILRYNGVVKDVETYVSTFKLEEGQPIPEGATLLDEEGNVIQAEDGIMPLTNVDAYIGTPNNWLKIFVPANQLENYKTTYPKLINHFHAIQGAETDVIDVQSSTTTNFPSIAKVKELILRYNGVVEALDTYIQGTNKTTPVNNYLKIYVPNNQLAKYKETYPTLVNYIYPITGDPGMYYTKKEGEDLEHLVETLNQGLGDKEDRVPVVVVSGETVVAKVGKYYRFDERVNTLQVTLPNVEEINRLKSLVLSFTTGDSPAITISANSEIIYFSGYFIEPNTTYEINLMFNGTKWIVAYGIIE